MKDIFFGVNHNAMWIYEPDSLKTMAANEAATVLYGYSKQEMLSLTIKNLLPESEIPKLQEEVKKRSQSESIIIVKDQDGRHQVVNRKFRELEFNDDQILGEIAKKIIL